MLASDDASPCTRLSSVSSMTSLSFRSSNAAFSALTRVVNSACVRICGETLTATVNDSGSPSQSASCATIRSKTSHVSGTMAPFVSASGMFRSVACVSALIAASQSAPPHQAAMTKPGRPDIAA